MGKNYYTDDTRLKDTNIPEVSIEIAVDQRLSRLGNGLINLGYSNVLFIPKDIQNSIKNVHSWLLMNKIDVLMIPMPGNLYNKFRQRIDNQWKYETACTARKYVIFNIANNFMEYADEVDLFCNVAFVLQHEDGIVSQTFRDRDKHVVDITEQHIANLKRADKRRNKEQEYKKRNNRTLRWQTREKKDKGYAKWARRKGY